MEFKLISKKINGTLTKEEEGIFNAWYLESKTHRTYFAKVEKYHSNGLDIVEIQKGWEKVSLKIRPRRKPIRNWHYAAVIAFLMVLGSLNFFFEKKVESSRVTDETIVKTEPIQIGSDKATLTLEDGSRVALEKGKTYTNGKVSSNGEGLIYKAASNTKTKSLVFNTLTIPKGGQFFLTLADGTQVWLNSDTQLRYPVVFDNDSAREVELLYGEAYFDVAPSAVNNRTHFLVKSNNQKVDVLGTEFNVKAYKEDAFIATTLVEGKVLVEQGSFSKTLEPGQQSRLYIYADKIDVFNVNIYNEISWKNGFFSFEDKTLEEIMSVLSRWYDVEVMFKNESVKKLTFNGVFRKTQQLTEILNTIENTNEVNYIINQKMITME